MKFISYKNRKLSKTVAMFCGLLSIAVSIVVPVIAQQSPTITGLGLEPANSNPFSTPAQNKTDKVFTDLLRSGILARKKGELHRALTDLLQANDLAQSLSEKSRATGEVGVVLLQGKRLAEAELWLTRAYNLAGASENEGARYRYALELGNVLSAGNDNTLANNYFNEAIQSQNPQLRLAARINALRVSDEQLLSDSWELLASDLSKIKNPKVLADYKLRLATLLQDQDNGYDSKAYSLITEALTLAKKNNMRRVKVGALELLSKMYEDNTHINDSRRLTAEAIASADKDFDQDLLILLYWRQGRLLEQQNKLDEAIEAYQQAVSNIEAIRFDIPVVYNDGRSSFRETLEPIYLGLANLLLKKAALPDVDAEPYLILARDSAEGIKQSELQDYLGDRCTVIAAQQTDKEKLEDDTALVYPIIFKDRIETLVETSKGINRYQSKVAKFQLTNMAKRFAHGLRIGQTNLQGQANALYKILLQPFVADLVDAGIKKVVVLPDGVLRLVPYSALHNGDKYALEDFAFSVSAALSLTHRATGGARPNLRVLVVGLETPGPVVEVLKKSQSDGVFSASATGESAKMCGAKNINPEQKQGALTLAEGKLRDLSCSLSERTNSTINKAVTTVALRELNSNSLRESLRLPGVVDEVNQLRDSTSARVLLNADFTYEKFASALRSADYNVIHMATHGVFGGSGDNSYLLSHDKLITMNALQGLLKSENLAGKNIELLSLSACETADGDDRAPLGISGAALKARAKSALGTLWPVSDFASKQVMVSFYKNYVAGLSKTEALQKAQLELLNNSETEEPFFWAPFILVGQWQ